MKTASTDPETVAGFRVLERVARGGMATVYKAEQVSVGRTVALKILRPRLADDEVFVERFQREARAAARLSHPNIVGAIDVGTAEGHHYFAMEYVEGQSAARLLKQAGRIEWREAVGIAAQVSRALEHARAHGMMHLDVKPANIMIDEGGRAKLADFGLARRPEDEDALYSERKLLFGTPAYMSPEQLTPGKELDIRSDIYSLGVTLYEMLSGEKPFRGKDRRETIRRIREGEFDPLREAVPDAPPHLDAVIAKAMALDRDERYATPKELLEDLESVLNGAPPRFALGLSARVGSGGPSKALANPLLRVAVIAGVVVLAVLLLALWIAGALRGGGGVGSPAAPPAEPAAPTVQEEYAALERAAGRAMGDSRYAQAARLYREFAAEREGHPLAAAAEEKAAEIEQGAGMYAESLSQAAVAHAEDGKFESARQILLTAERAVGELGRGVIESARSRVEALRRAAEGEQRQREEADAARALEALKERLSELRAERAFPDALAQCDGILANPALAAIHGEARALREPFARMVEFEQAALAGAGSARGREIAVGGRRGRVAGMGERRLHINVGGTPVSAGLDEIAPEDLFGLALAGGGRDRARLRENAALYFEAVGDEEAALVHASAAIREGARQEWMVEMERRLLVDTARNAVEAEEWDRAIARVGRIMRDPNHRPFVQANREDLLDIRRAAVAGQRYVGMVLVPAGPFARDEEEEVSVPAFYIDRHEVTVGEYAAFVEAVDERGAPRYYGDAPEFRNKNPRPSNWERMLEHPDKPVVGVDWHDASAYARFVGKRLPRAVEWEKAARGTEGYAYPWGNAWVDGACNYRAQGGGVGGPAPVGSFEKDRSPYGCYDMAGNVREWTADKAPDGRRIVKGGSYIASSAGCDLRAETTLVERARDPWTGFRCAARPR